MYENVFCFLRPQIIGLNRFEGHSHNQSILEQGVALIYPQNPPLQGHYGSLFFWGGGIKRFHTTFETGGTILS